MKRWTQTALLCVALAVPATACEKGEPNPDQQAQLKRDNEGSAWRTLLQNLKESKDDETKVKMLNRFIESHPDHPDIADAKRRLEALTSSPEKEAQEALAKQAQLAFEEGNAKAFTALVLAAAIDRKSPRHERDALAAPVAVPTPKGYENAEKSLFEHPLVIRGHVRNTLFMHAKDKIEERCGRVCVNEAIGTFLGKSLGGALFLEDGKLNPEAVGPLLEQTWVEPADKLLEVDGKTWYAVFKPTVHAYYKVGKVVEGLAPEEAAKKLASLTDAKEVKAFYTQFETDNKIGEQSGVDAGDARAIAGWWLRRYADGTAKAFSDHALKVAEAYDPELVAK